MKMINIYMHSTYLYTYPGIPQYLLDRLQRVQNAAARRKAEASKSDHTTPILNSLH